MNQKEAACRDFGYSCDFVARGSNENDVLEQLRQHGKSQHGLKDEQFTPDFIQRIRAKIHDRKVA